MNLDIKFPAVLDSTIVKAWKSCPRRTLYEHFCGLREGGDMASVDLVAGGAMAKGLETARKAFYFEGMTAINAIDEGQIALGMAYGSDRPAEKKNLPRVRAAFQHYFDKWPLDRTFGIVPIPDGVEKSFALPIGDFKHPDTGEALLYAGRIDMLGELKAEASIFGYDDVPAGEFYGVDEKTTGSINSLFYSRYDLDFQMLGYLYSYRKMGIPLKGIQVRGIGLTNKKDIDVTTDYKETFVNPPDEVINDWYDELLLTVDYMLWVYKKGDESAYSQAFGNSCNDFGRSCAFKPVCGYYPAVPEYSVIRWNPLERD